MNFLPVNFAAVHIIHDVACASGIIWCCCWFMIWHEGFVKDVFNLLPVTVIFIWRKCLRLQLVQPYTYIAVSILPSLSVVFSFHAEFIVRLPCWELICTVGLAQYWVIINWVVYWPDMQNTGLYNGTFYFYCSSFCL